MIITRVQIVTFVQSPGEKKRREVCWTLRKKLDSSAGPGEIKRREVCWTLRKKLVSSAGPGEFKRREVRWTHRKKLVSSAGPGEIKRREVVLDPQVNPEEIKSWEVELGSQKVGLLLLQMLFLNSSATDTVLVTLLRTAVERAVV